MMNASITRGTLFRRHYSSWRCPIKELQNVVKESVSSTLSMDNIKPEISKPTLKSSKADFQCNVALGLAKRISKSPRHLAQDLVSNISQNGTFKKVSVSGPGFIEFQLNDNWLFQTALQMSTDGINPSSKPSQNSAKVLIDMGGPNCGKELHVGHLRSGVIGDTLANILSFTGSSVSKVSHVGDMGAAVGTLIAQYLEEYNDKSAFTKNNNNSSVLSISEMTKLYVKGKERLKSKDSDFTAKVHRVVLELQNMKEGEDTIVTRAWKKLCRISKEDGYDIIWKNLGVSMEEKGEASYRHLLPSVVSEFSAKNLVKVSNGAKCVFFETNIPPLILQKSDGGYLYATTDLAALRHRVCDEKFDKILYVVDKSQSLHFTQLFEAATRVGWIKHKCNNTVSHVSFGLVLGNDGKKLSSRKGEAITLKSLMDQALSQFENNTENDDSKLLAYGAVRYYELSNNRQKNYKFSWEKALNARGNSSIYLIYGYARLESILKKYNQTFHTRNTWHDFLNESSVLLCDHERRVLIQLSLFQHAVKNSEKSLAPHLLCDYLHTLVEVFNGFYEECKIISNNQEHHSHRLIICAMTSNVLHRGLNLLGVPVVSQI